MRPEREADRADWWRSAVVYQVYPSSFADSTGTGRGDLRGVLARLPHLVELGVDALWLSPFYPSALADGGYDVDDPRAVDPRNGTLADLTALVAAAHHAGVKVVVDVVPNHTSDRHAWFREALAAAPGSAARERYLFRDGAGPGGTEPPSDWRSAFGGSAWERVPDGQWYLHLFTAQQPDLNWDHPDVRDDAERTLRFWADLGVDGFRVDVADGLAKDLSTPYRPQAARSDLPSDGSDPLLDRDAVHEVYRGWRRVFAEYDPPRTAVAEAWVPPARRYRYARPDELGQAFTFDLLTAPFDPTAFRTTIDTNLTHAAAVGTAPTWVLSNHDVVRHPTRYGLPPGTDLDAWLLSGGARPALDAGLGLRRARAATLLLLALPGSAYLYQGEELGLHEVADLPLDALADPVWERSSHHRKGRDGCRVPLPWDAGAPHHGFTRGTPWLPQPAWFADVAASAQAGVPGSTLELYRRALALRRDLQAGETLSWLPAPRQVVAFTRGPRWCSVTNFGDEPVPLTGRVLLASGPMPSTAVLPGATTAWVTPPDVP